MPLTYHSLAAMQAAMVDIHNLQAEEVRLSGENIAQLQQDSFGSPIAIRYMSLPVNTVEFFVPRLHRDISLEDWDSFSSLPGRVTFSVRSGNVSRSVYTPPTERTFVFDGETFICRLSPEPVPAEPAEPVCLPSGVHERTYTFDFTPSAQPPPNRIDFLLEVLDDGVDEPHAED